MALKKDGQARGLVVMDGVWHCVRIPSALLVLDVEAWGRRMRDDFLRESLTSDDSDLDLYCAELLSAWLESPSSVNAVPAELGPIRLRQLFWPGSVSRVEFPSYLSRLLSLAKEPEWGFVPEFVLFADQAQPLLVVTEDYLMAHELSLPIHSHMMSLGSVCHLVRTYGPGIGGMSADCPDGYVPEYVARDVRLLVA